MKTWEVFLSVAEKAKKQQNKKKQSREALRRHGERERDEGREADELPRVGQVLLQREWTCIKHGGMLLTHSLP